MIPDAATLVPLRRVLPPMAAALLAEPLGWAVVAWPGTLGASWMGRPRLVVAVHLLTVGTLLLSVLGAGWQLLPVDTTRPLSPGVQRAAGAINGAALAGAALLVGGLSASATAAAAAAGLLIAALLARSGLVVSALVRGRGRVAMRAWLLGAEVCLWAGVGLGAALVANRLGLQWLPDHYGGIGLHASALLGGWVTGWILGLGGLLLPMFGVAPEPPSAASAAAAGLLFGGLVLQVGALWAAGAALAAALLGWSLHRRAKRALGPGLAGASLGLAGLGVTAGLAAWADHPPGMLAVAAGLALFALPVLRGVALRILPFLAWAHAFGGELRGAPAVAALVPARAAWVSVGLSLAGGLGVVGGLAAGQIGVVRVGAMALALCGITHLGVALTIGRRAALYALRRGAVAGTEAR